MDQIKSYFCCHCGSSNTKITESGNDDMEMFVAEESDCSTEFYDSIVMIKCEVCSKISYPSQS